MAELSVNVFSVGQSRHTLVLRGPSQVLPAVQGTFECKQHGLYAGLALCIMVWSVSRLGMITKVIDTDSFVVKYAVCNNLCFSSRTHCGILH